MPVFLFWNVGRKSPVDLIGAACHEHKVDILLLAELEAPTSEIVKVLNSTGEPAFNEYFRVPSPITFFHRLPEHAVQAVSDDGRVSIRSVKPPLGREILLIACHLRSKLFSDPADQYFAVRAVRKKIIEAEKSAGHQNSILIGDLNMNPFEHIMNAADGLHAVMNKQIAEKKSRVFQGEEWDFFYNPMWSRLGDELDGPSGTYYRGAAHAADYYWNTFDQVLLRPSLLPFYQRHQLSVLTKINETELLRDGTIDSSVSDHLPLLVSLTTEMDVSND